MASLKDTVETNRKILFVVVCLMIIAGLLMFRFYNAQKRENRALRLKILSMSENRRTPKSWTQLTTKTTQPVQTAQPAATATTTTTATTPTTVSQTVDAQDTQTLATRLARRMRSVKGLDEAGIDNNIAIADEIISREPDSYGAYKAKLISLLTKEGKFNQAADENEIENLLENMAQFNTSNDFIARREAALISNTNADIQNVEVQLEEVARQRETLESQLSSIDPNSQDYAAINAQMQTLDTQEAQLLTNIDSLANNLDQNRAQVANEDIIEIPFMRMLAHDDYDGVIDNAQAFIDQFPASPSGYYYMVRAMQLQGNKEDALNVIRNATLPPEAQQALLQRLDAASNENPKDYWQKLNF